MGDKLKLWLCDEGALLGKVAHFFARLGVSTEIEVDVRGFDVLAIYCWCCTFWRGVLFGGAVGVALGLLAAWLMV